MDEPNSTSSEVDRHDLLYSAGSKLVWPHLQLANRPPKALSTDARIAVESGIAKLQAALEVRPNSIKNWSTFWLLGKAYQALGDLEKSYQCFKSAFEMNPNHLDTARELMESCLRTRRMAEGLCAANAARDLAPSNAGIIANLALALFENDQLEAALSAGREALRLAPSDRVTQSLVRRIEQAKADGNQDMSGW
jgi:tetratricopeptide (TPR) repeat protein